MDLPARSRLVSLATAPGRVYRRLYGISDSAPARGVTSEAEWQALPMLTKEFLLQIPLAERSFIPVRDIDYIIPSSGTTGNLPLLTPRTHLLEYQFRPRFYSTPKAALTSKPVAHQQEMLIQTQGAAPRVVVLDLMHPAASARLAREVRVDCIYAMVSHLSLITPHLVREGAAKGIRYIEMAGEKCSRSFFELLRAAFPNAVIVSSYGITDVENSAMGIPCRAMGEAEPLEMYHVNDGCYMELYDAERNAILPPVAGTEGELLISAYRGEPASFPMVRYRCGDRARVVETACEEHGQWTFMLLGRAAMDFIRFPGGVLQADEVERVLRLMPERVSDRFQLHSYVSDGEHGPLRVVLHVERRGATSFAELAQAIASLMRVGPALTYGEAVTQGRLRPLECAPLEVEASASKHKRMQAH